MRETQYAYLAPRNAPQPSFMMRAFVSGGDEHAVKLQVWIRYDIVSRVLAWNVC